MPYNCITAQQASKVLVFSHVYRYHVITFQPILQKTRCLNYTASRGYELRFSMFFYGICSSAHLNTLDLGLCIPLTFQ